MTDKAIEAAIKAYYEDVPCYADTEMRLRAAIAAYEQALWQKEEICENAICHLINGEVWYRPLPPPPRNEE